MLNLKKILLAAMAYLIAITAMSQVTTGTITGTVKDATNAPLVGTSIEVTHEPSGSRYKSVSTTSGKYTVPGLRIGGPYKVVFTYVGLKTETVTDVYIQLGEPSVIDVSL
ncbi:MAG: carboxypeptidase-like regulatory domain-containing protein, partial [Bacteroidota bacterium]